MSKIEFALLVCIVSLVIFMIYLWSLPDSHDWCIEQGYDGSAKGMCYKEVDGMLHMREYIEIGLSNFHFVVMEDCR